MNIIVDIMIVLVISFGLYIGYQQGIIKQLVDLIILYIVSFISGIISDKLFNLLYNYLPFFNFKGKAQGLKSINIIFWKVLLYITCILLILSLISKIFKKIKIEEKINNTVVEAGFISKILGTLISISLMFILIFNIMLVLLSPNFNLKIIADSKLAPIVLENIPILSSQNSILYQNQKYILKRINKNDNYKKINNDILRKMLSSKLVSKEVLKDLKVNNKLVGTRKKTNIIENDDPNFNDNNDQIITATNNSNEKGDIINDKDNYGKGDVVIDNDNYIESDEYIESDNYINDEEDILDLDNFDDLNFEDYEDD